MNIGIKNTLFMVYKILQKRYFITYSYSLPLHYNNQIKIHDMNANALCPISINKIDENVARLNGTFTVVLLALFVITQNIVPIAILFIDFLLRGAELGKYSPLAISSKFLLNLFKVKKHPINAGPKIFAARIGVIFSFGILVTSAFQFSTFSLILTAIFGLCAFLEAAFSFCVACQIYPFVYKFTYQSKLKFSKK